MKIPKYIDEALRKRANAAFRFLQHDGVVSEFIEKHNIDVNFEDYGGGVESILNPYESENAVREAILTHKNNKEKRMTNFERIKNMSIDEMTNAIKNGHLGDPCDYCSFSKEPCACLCVEGIVMWLNSEVEE